MAGILDRLVLAIRMMELSSSSEAGLQQILLRVMEATKLKVYLPHVHNISRCEGYYLFDLGHERDLRKGMGYT